ARARRGPVLLEQRRRRRGGGPSRRPRHAGGDLSPGLHPARRPLRSRGHPGDRRRAAAGVRRSRRRDRAVRARLPRRPARRGRRDVRPRGRPGPAGGAVLTGEPPRPLRTVLVANRGEIAVRVIRAARDAGLRSVAVHGGPDRAALHVREADAAVALDGDDAASTYLNPKAVVAAAVEAGADAVHPGYGFLSEDAGFARAVLDAGLVWIGPPPETIRDLGDKVVARRIARDAGAPLADGTTDPVRDADDVAAFAREHGLPLVVKAAHGGGGRGLVVVRDEAEIADAFARATREATAAFGRGECFVERFLDRARHVE